MLRGEVLTKQGQWWDAELLIDSGADRTVFSADVYRALGEEPAQTEEMIAGIGGVIAVPVVTTQIRLTRDDGGKVVFRGRYAACLAPDALDMSVLGRDILSLFAVIVDRPADVVCLLGGQHSYRIQGPFWWRTARWLGTKQAVISVATLVLPFLPERYVMRLANFSRGCLLAILGCGLLVGSVIGADPRAAEARTLVSA